MCSNEANHVVGAQAIAPQPQEANHVMGTQAIAPQPQEANHVMGTQAIAPQPHDANHVMGTQAMCLSLKRQIMLWARRQEHFHLFLVCCICPTALTE
eukprot:1158076-Pelagomonas_calceolata.AAC.9